MTVKGCAVNNLKHIGFHHSARHADLRDRCVRLGQVLVRQRNPVQKAGSGAERREDACRRARRDSSAWRIWIRSSTLTSRPSDARRAPTRRPIPACSTISANCSPRPQTRRQRGYGAEPFLLQRQGRPLRGLRGRRPAQNRDALSAGCLCALRCVQGQALQQGDARGALQGQEHL